MGVLGGTLSECYFLWGACSGHGSFHSPYPAIHMASLCRLDLDGAIWDFCEVKGLGSLRGWACLMACHVRTVFVRWWVKSLTGTGCGSSTSPTLVWVSGGGGPQVKADAFTWGFAD